jgi:hypothetical protein
MKKLPLFYHIVLIIAIICALPLNIFVLMYSYGFLLKMSSFGSLLDILIFPIFLLISLITFIPLLSYIYSFFIKNKKFKKKYQTFFLIISAIISTLSLIIIYMLSNITM